MSNPYFNLNAFFSHSQSPHGSPDLIDQKEYVHVKKLKCEVRTLNRSNSNQCFSSASSKLDVLRSEQYSVDETTHKHARTKVELEEKKSKVTEPLVRSIVEKKISERRGGATAAVTSLCTSIEKLFPN